MGTTGLEALDLGIDGSIAVVCGELQELARTNELERMRLSQGAKLD
jgi:hypothetical protein